MNVVVCVKQIPDPAAPQSLDASYNLDRSGKLILDEADTYGVEMALQLVDKAGSGEVTVVSMGSAADVAGLRNALAMGAAKAVIVSDDALRGTDALGTAKVLAAVIKREIPDLILAATESSDGYTGTTPVQLAELLGLPSITFAKSVAVDGSSVKVERQTAVSYTHLDVYKRQGLPVDLRAPVRHGRRFGIPLPRGRRRRAGLASRGRRHHPARRQGRDRVRHPQRRQRPRCV